MQPASSDQTEAFMTRFWRWKPHQRERERLFDFIERPRRHERWFKRAIVCGTLLAMCVPLVVLPRGRYLLAEAASRARKAGRAAIAQETPRTEIDQDWQRSRLRGIALSRRRLTEMFVTTEPAYQGLMRYAGLDPDHGLLRWGNYDQTLLLPSTVFEPDELGRSYRMRPCVDSIWLRDVPSPSGVLAFFLVPDRPELRDAIKGTLGIPMEKSKQSTNSWGLRGPEPELDAPVRGIVLGDSFMQGLFVDDEHTPPECLRRDLERRLKSKVSVVNAGVLGYSPEQYYYSLVAFADRFRPQFVVVSVFANDFGEASQVTNGGGDWVEGKYWLDRILSLTQAQGWTCLFVPVPASERTLGRRKSGFYPGAISNALGTSAVMFLNPAEAFVSAHLSLLIEAEERGERPSGCLLYNEKIHDGHFSALGAQVWAETVGRRLALLIEMKDPQ
jgi:lysophospholipase L1-like esterase